MYRDDTLHVRKFLLIISITIWRLLEFSIGFSALVAFANFLLCVFLCDGTVALCDCPKHTKTFGVCCTEGHVWGHVAMAPGGAWLWRRGGQIWHALHTPWPCHTGKRLSGWCILRECLFRQTLGRFYGLIMEDIYWLNVWHTKYSIQEQTHTQTRRNKRRKWDIKQQYRQVIDGQTAE